MSYISNNLLNGEEVIYESKLHWIVFLGPAIIFAIGILLPFNDLLGQFKPLLILAGLVMGVLAFIDVKTSEFGITNKRVIVKVGFIRRKSIEVLLTKVEGIDVDQSILGRVLDFGTIVVSGTGGTKDPFKNIASPMELRRRAQEQIAKIQEPIAKAAG